MTGAYVRLISDLLNINVLQNNIFESNATLRLDSTDLDHAQMGFLCVGISITISIYPFVFIGEHVSSCVCVCAYTYV